MASGGMSTARRMDAMTFVLSTETSMRNWAMCSQIIPAAFQQRAELEAFRAQESPSRQVTPGK